MEVLSEHNCHGWLEGYTLTGRRGLFATYEAFAMVSASMTIQHSKWLEEGRLLDWRKPVPSLNILLTSTCWRNDHNGFSHQGPGLIQNVITKRGEVARVYLPPDANTLLSVADHCFRSEDYTNLIVIDKQPQLQYLTMAEAIEHCEKGASVWEWAGNDDGASDPDIVLACAGDVVTMETVAAADILKQKLPHMKVRVVNVVDLMVLPRPKDHPHGMDDLYFEELFTDDVDVVFAFHGYPGAIHQLVHGRPMPIGSACAGSSRRARPPAVRHGRAQQGQPVPPGDGCDQQLQAQGGRRCGTQGMVRGAVGQARAVHRGQPDGHAPGRGLGVGRSPRSGMTRRSTGRRAVSVSGSPSWRWTPGTRWPPARPPGRCPWAC